MFANLRYIFQENLNFSKQITKLSRSELVKKYKGAALGVLWLFIRPTTTIFAFWFAIEIGIRGGVERAGHPYIVYLVAGIIPWFFMSDIILDGARSLRTHKHFVTKMPFPVSTIMTITSLSHFYVHIGMLLVGYLILIMSGVGPSIYNLQLIFYYMPMMLIFFTCLSWITAPLSAISKDFENLINSSRNLIFWLSGILWDPYSIENPVIRTLVQMNPVNYFANGYRNGLINEKWFWETPFETAFFLGLLIVVCVGGSYVFVKLRKTIPDVL